MHLVQQEVESETFVVEEHQDQVENEVVAEEVVEGIVEDINRDSAIDFQIDRFEVCTAYPPLSGPCIAEG